MKPATAEIRDVGLVRRAREDDEDEAIQQPLEWSLIRRCFTYAAPVRGKLTAQRPETVGQASRISGVTPAAVSLLLVYLRKRRLQQAA